VTDERARLAGRPLRGEPALIEGSAVLAWAPGGHPRVVFTFTIAGGKIAAIDMTADPHRIRPLDITILSR